MSDLKQDPPLEANCEQLLVSDVLLHQAEQMCKRRLADNPNDPAALASLARTYRKQGNLDGALAIYRKLTLLNPDDREACYLLAVLSGTDAPSMPPGFRPAPFVVLENFLPRSIHETLMPFVLAARENLVPARITNGEDPDGEYKPQARESLELLDDCEAKTVFRRQLVTIIPKVIPRLHLAPFELGHLEVKVRAYLDGHFFRIHMDCPPIPENVANRQLSYVYFFHKTPRAFTGGDLLLFDSNPDLKNSNYTTASFTRIVPEDNRIVFFPSIYFHSVIPVRCPSQDFLDSRFVINGHLSKRVPRAVGEAAPASDSASLSPVATAG